MTEKHTDDFFEGYLDGDSDVSRGYAALASDEPPAQVDRAVLAMAKMATRKSASPNTGYWRWNRWLVSAGLGATLTLSVVVVVGIITSPDVDLVRQAGQPSIDAMPASRLPAAARQQTPERLTETLQEQLDRRPPVEKPTPEFGGTSGNPSLSRLAVTPVAVPPATEPMLPTATSELLTGNIPAHAVEQFAEDVAADHRVDELAARTPGAGKETVASGPATDDTDEGLITVTGSQIVRVDIQAPRPVSIIGAGDFDDESAALAESDSAKEGVAAVHTERGFVLYAPGNEASRKVTDNSLRRRALLNVPDAMLPDLEPRDWLERIEALSQSGERKQALDELEQFKKNHPDFPLDDFSLSE